MIAIRKTEIPIKNIKDFKIGDQIKLGEYTATCQKIGKKGSIFLFDQYLDNHLICMYNKKDECFKGYEGSEVRKFLLEFEKNYIFDDIREYMIAFKNGDLLRIPMAEEIFYKEDVLNKYYPILNKTQWLLMKDKTNRLAFWRKDGKQKSSWGWLQNNDKDSASNFAYIDSYGNGDCTTASNLLAIRIVFRLA